MSSARTPGPLGSGHERMGLRAAHHNNLCYQAEKRRVPTMRRTIKPSVACEICSIMQELCRALRLNMAWVYEYLLACGVGYFILF